MSETVPRPASMVRVVGRGPSSEKKKFAEPPVEAHAPEGRGPLAINTD